MESGEWKVEDEYIGTGEDEYLGTGLEALAGGGGTSPAKASSPAFIYPLSTIHYPLSTIIIMSEFELFLWIIFTLLFSLIPLKPLFRLFLEQFGIKDTTPFLYEAGEHEHYSQLYRPGDRKYKHIIELCNKAKPIN